MEIRIAGSCSWPAADKLCDFRPGSSPPQMSFSSAVNKDRLDSMLAIVPFSFGTHSDSKSVGINLEKPVTLTQCVDSEKLPTVPGSVIINKGALKS